MFENKMGYCMNVAASAIVTIGMATSAVAQDTVTINYGYLPFPVMPIFAGQAHGLFEDAGIELNMTKFTSGPAEFQALQSGSIDLAHGALAAYYMGSTRGLDAQWIYAFGNNAPQVGLVVSSGSGATSITDLAGSKVSAPAGSILHLAHLSALKDAGMEGGDVNFISLAPPQAVAAMNSGDIDAAWFWDPFVTKAIEDGAELAFTLEEMGVNDIFGIAANESWLAEEGNAEVAARLLGVFEEAAAMYAADPEPTLDEVETLLGMNRELARKLIAGAQWFTLEDQRSSEAVGMANIADPSTGARAQITWVEDVALWGGLIEQQGAGETFLNPAPINIATGSEN